MEYLLVFTKLWIINAMKSVKYWCVIMELYR